MENNTYKKYIVTELSPDFRKVTRIVTVPIPKPNHDEVVVKNLYLGINASDVNFTSGKYTPGLVPPFDCGFEAIGKIVACGSSTKLKIGQAVACSSYSAFGEYQILKEKLCIPVPYASPEILPVMVSGLTASIALEQCGNLKIGKTVLVTAAAGATGQFAVQFAKLAGCHVIGTCSSDSKVSFLKSLGIDRAINYKKENLKSVLKKEYPKGIDVVYESVGGDTFDTCVDSLAVKGTLIVIGFISGYKDGKGWKEQQNQKLKTPLPVKLLSKSTNVQGFFLNNYTTEWKRHMQLIMKLNQQRKIKITLDNGNFSGLSSIPDAIDHLLSGKNIGKVWVNLENHSSL